MSGIEEKLGTHAAKLTWKDLWWKKSRSKIFFVLWVCFALLDS